VKRSSGFARITLSSARWLLPWIAGFLVSVTLAYAMGSAIPGSALPSDQQPEVQAQSTTSLAATMAAESCSGIANSLTKVGVDWWIMAEDHRKACNPANGMR